MADVYRRCGCRDDRGRTYPPLPERASGLQAAAACPLLSSDSKHGSWGFAVSAGTKFVDGTVKRQQVRKMGFATKREAQQARAKVVSDIATGRYKSDQKMTLGVYLPTWLERRVQDGLKPSTAVTYRRYITNDLLPALGTVKLVDLRRAHVDKMIRDLRSGGRGATTIRRIHAVLSSALTAAQHLDLVDGNAAAKVALPQASHGRVKVWEPDQVRSFLALAERHRLSPVFELAVFSGLRRGELVGLRWVDVDFTKRELVVRQQRVRAGAQVFVGTVKTDSGQDRHVSLGSEAIGALLEWKMKQTTERELLGDAYADDGWVFTYEDGRPLRPEHVSRTFDSLVTAAGLPRMTLHGLRHQHASLLLSAGVEIGVTSKRLGHSTIGITSDLYSHLLSDVNRAAAEAAESMLPMKGGVAHTSHTPSP